MSRRFAIIGPLIGLLAFAAGCGDSSLVKVQGKVVSGGAPVTLRRGEMFQVVFHKFAGDTEVNLFSARVNNADGTFQVIGPERKGISQGNYRVSVEVVDPRGSDRLHGAFSLENTPFRYEVSKDTPEIILDIETKTNTKTN